MATSFSAHPLFQDLGPDDISTLDLFSEEKILAEYEILFRQGDDASAIYFVMDGKLEIYKNNPEGWVDLVTIQKTGDVCGEMAFFDPDADHVRNASVRAGQWGAILRVLVDTALMDLSEDHPSIYHTFETIVQTRKK